MSTRPKLAILRNITEELHISDRKIEKTEKRSSEVNKVRIEKKG